MTVDLSSLAKMWPRRRSASGSQPTGIDCEGAVGGQASEVSASSSSRISRDRRAHVVVALDRVPARLIWQDVAVSREGRQTSQSAATDRWDGNAASTHASEVILARLSSVSRSPTSEATVRVSLKRRREASREALPELTWTLDRVVLPVYRRREAEGARPAGESSSLERMPRPRLLDRDRPCLQLEAIELSKCCRNHPIAEQERLVIGWMVGKVSLEVE